MTWSAEPSIPEGFRWPSQKKVAGVKCSESRSIKHGLWFQQSILTFHEILRIANTHWSQCDIPRSSAHATCSSSCGPRPTSASPTSGMGALMSSAIA